MIIVSLPDIHGQTAPIAQLGAALTEADLVLLTGDITHFGGAAAARRVLDALRAAGARRIRAVPGNCDHPGVAGLLEDEKISLDARWEDIDGLVIVGLGGSLPCPGATPNEYGETELAAMLATAAKNLPAGRPLVLASHQPPFETLNDRLSNGTHVGSRAVRDFITTQRPLVCFTGHIHEAAGVDAIGPSRIVNPGPLWRGHFARARIEKGLAEVRIEPLAG